MQQSFLILKRMTKQLIQKFVYFLHVKVHDFPRQFDQSDSKQVNGKNLKMLLKRKWMFTVFDFFTFRSFWVSFSYFIDL